MWIAGQAAKWQHYQRSCTGKQSGGPKQTCKQRCKAILCQSGELGEILSLALLHLSGSKLKCNIHVFCFAFAALHACRSRLADWQTHVQPTSRALSRSRQQQPCGGAASKFKGCVAAAQFFYLDRFVALAEAASVRLYRCSAVTCVA